MFYLRGSLLIALFVCIVVLFVGSSCSRALGVIINRRLQSRGRIRAAFAFVAFGVFLVAALCFLSGWFQVFSFSANGVSIVLRCSTYGSRVCMFGVVRVSDFARPSLACGFVIAVAM